MKEFQQYDVIYKIIDGIFLSIENPASHVRIVTKTPQRGISIRIGQRPILLNDNYPSPEGA
jgi:hypothetical protein